MALNDDFVETEIKMFYYKTDTPFRMLQTITAKRDSKNRQNITIENLEEGKVYTAEAIKYCGWDIKDLYFRQKIITIANLPTDPPNAITITNILFKEEKKEIIMQPSVLKITNYTQNVEIFWNIQPFYYDTAKMWWLWNNNLLKWDMVDETDIMNAIDKELNLSGETINSQIKNNYIEAFKRLGRKKKPMDLPKTFIQFKDKLYDLSNDNIINATKEYFNTNPIPYDIGANDTTPIMDRIFIEWVGAENVQTLYEIIAYCCLQDYPLARIFCFVGSGSNGKSCYQNLIKKFIGNENCTSVELDFLLERFGTSGLYKKLVCLMGETNFNQLKKTSLLKRLSGNDSIDFEFKGKNRFSANNYAKLIISTNTLPITTDKTDGFYRRWLIVKFPNKFDEKKDVLAEIPEIEFNNLCRKSINILKTLFKDRKFTNEGNIEERKNNYEKHSNPLKNFINERCVIDINAIIPTFEFYDAFIIYLKERGYREMSKDETSKLMIAESFEIERKWITFNDENKQWRHYIGIRLKQKHENQQNLMNKRDFVTPVTPVTPISTQFSIYRNGVESGVTPVTPVTKLPFSPVLIHNHCSKCGIPESNYYHLGKPLCHKCGQALLDIGAIKPEDIEIP